MPNCTHCEKEATASYVWDWGETGLACPEHQVILRQQAARLHRGVSISPLQPGAPTPITRDERIASKARIMALEEEIAECQARGLELYRAHEAVQAQLRTETAKRTALELELQTQRARVDELLEQVGLARQDAARENDELQRLRALVPRDPPPEVDAHPQG